MVENLDLFSEEGLMLGPSPVQPTQLEKIENLNIAPQLIP